MGFKDGQQSLIDQGYEKIKHGMWIDIEPAPYNLLYATCSVGGERQTLEVAKYCPNCGASMMDDNATQHTERVENALGALDEME
jgi:hypothetical protein